MSKKRSCLVLGAHTRIICGLLQHLQEQVVYPETCYVPLHKMVPILGVSLPVLEMMVRPFVANGVLMTKRGTGGGYRLGPRAKDLTLLELLMWAESCEPREHDILDRELAVFLEDTLVFHS